MALIGLVRVSTDKQNTQRQHDALDPICLKVFEEKISGKLATDDRPALLNALGHIRDGDMLTVQEVDRLGRNLLEGLIVLNDLFQRGVGVKVLEGIAAGEHTERSLILDLALALAEDRRRDITRKTKNGLEAARAGNPSVPSPPESRSPSASSTRPSQAPRTRRPSATTTRIRTASDDETGPPGSLTSPAVRLSNPLLPAQPSSAELARPRAIRAIGQ
jgi:hypothetical protein